MGPQDQEFHRRADQEIQFIEDLEAWLPGQLDQSDLKLAQAVQHKFDIPVDVVLKCLSDGRDDMSTLESILLARKEHCDTN